MKNFMVITLGLALSSGCAISKYREECEARHPAEAEAINQCIDSRREDSAVERKARREDDKARQLGCHLPYFWDAKLKRCKMMIY